MVIGIPREIKPEEKRVSATLEGVRVFVRHGHKVIVEKRAGMGCGIFDDAFRKAGGTITRGNVVVWEKADMILKVKEPVETEWPLMRKNQNVFTFLHLAAKKKLAVALLKKE